MAADIKTFWSALISVLLKCFAALGFATSDRAAVRTPAPAPARTKALVATVATEAEGAAAEPAGPLTPPRSRRAVLPFPAPRAYEPQPRFRERGRTLPPTMKQRICAEAHGSSPSARSLRPGSDLTDERAESALSGPKNGPLNETMDAPLGGRMDGHSPELTAGRIDVRAADLALCA